MASASNIEVLPPKVSAILLLSNEQGFSLIEALMASVIISGVVAGFVMSFPTLMKNQVDTEKRTQVLNAVQDRIGMIQSLPYASVFLTDKANFDPLAPTCNCNPTPASSQKTYDNNSNHFGPLTLTSSGIPIRLTTCVVEIDASGSPVCPGPAETGQKSITVRGEFQSGLDKKEVVSTTLISSPEPPSALPSGLAALTGRVTAQENALVGLTNIPVKAYDNTGAICAITWTNSSGFYSLNGMGAGPFTIAVQLRTNDDTVIFPGNGGDHINIIPGFPGGLDFAIQNSAIPLRVSGARGTTVLASAAVVVSAPSVLFHASGVPLYTGVTGADQSVTLSVSASQSGTYHVYCIAPPPGTGTLVEAGLSPIGPAAPGSALKIACP